jgi:Phosphate/sulphate permeases
MSIALIVTIVLVMGVIFVNGWTDAPNAIATAVSTRVLRPHVAIVMAVIMNFLGALVMTLFNAQVAETISNIVSFDGAGNTSQIALAASLFAIVTWSVAAWWFGIPTSESHALIAGLTGAAMALGGLQAVNATEWWKVLIGLVVSTVLGLGGGYLITKLIIFIFVASIGFFPTKSSLSVRPSVLWQWLFARSARWTEVHGCLHADAVLQPSSRKNWRWL